MGAAAALGQPAIGITDHGNLYGVVDFVKAARQHQIKPIIGIEAYLTDGSRFERPPADRPTSGTTCCSTPRTRSGIAICCRCPRSHFSRATTTSRGWTSTCWPSTPKASLQPLAVSGDWCPNSSVSTQCQKRETKASREISTLRWLRRLAFKTSSGATASSSKFRITESRPRPASCLTYWTWPSGSTLRFWPPTTPTTPGKRNTTHMTLCCAFRRVPCATSQVVFGSKAQSTTSSRQSRCNSCSPMINSRMPVPTPFG